MSGSAVPLQAIADAVITARNPHRSAVVRGLFAVTQDVRYGYLCVATARVQYGVVV